MVSVQRRDLRSCGKAACVGTAPSSMNSIFKHKDFSFKDFVLGEGKFPGEQKNPKPKKQLCTETGVWENVNLCIFLFWLVYRNVNLDGWLGPD